MVALTVPGRTSGAASPLPALCQLVGGRIHIIGYHLVTGVDASRQEDAGLASVEIGSSEEIFGRTVSIAIAPLCFQTALPRLQSHQGVVEHLIGFGGETVEIEQIFCAIMHKPLSALCGTVVLGGITYGLGGAIAHVQHRTVGSTHHTFCLAIAIPVVGGNIDLIVLEVAHIAATVDPPQAFATHLVCLDDGVAIVGTGIAVVKLDNQLQFTVTVQIGSCGIIGHKGGCERAVVHLDFLIVGCQRSGRRRLGLCHSPHHGLYCIGRGGGATCIKIVRHAERCRVQFCTVTIDVVGHIVILVCSDAPGAEHSLSRLYCHQSSVELVCLLSLCLHIHVARHEHQEKE